MVTCDPPPPIKDGDFSPSKDMYNYEEVVRYKCRDNLEVNGSQKLRCTSEGTFDSAPPNCVRECLLIVPPQPFQHKLSFYTSVYKSEQVCLDSAV